MTHDPIDTLAAIRLVAEYDPMEDMIIAGVRSFLEKISAVTWERVRDETRMDIHMIHLINLIQNGFPQDMKDLPPQLQTYWQHRNNLSTIDDVVMYEDRILVPPSLRAEVCTTLHSAHQVVTAMNARARSTVFWPGITTAIQRTREECDSCWKMAPSQCNQSSHGSI